MISILIPVYNTAVFSLAETVSNQLNELGKEGEIIIIDDFSAPFYRDQNKAVATLSRVKYLELDVNAGRQKIRNYLAEEACFEWLLFLDGDSRILQHDFLSIYYQQVNNGCQVLVGGRTYPDDKPLSCSKVLHWKYGKTREDIRRKRTGFMTNNFCIQKNLFKSISRNLQLDGYGHEDTLMGIKLEEAGAKICLVKNAVLHDGIEDTKVFIKKTNAALHNLLAISSAYDAKILKRHVRLFYWFYTFKKIGLGNALLFAYRTIQKPLEKNLLSCNPSLTGFDFYRLSQLFLIDKGIK
ncbi:MAG: glycosyltransferase family 2 protein [Flavisolibacter sp.]|jgi:glycosyltransferase involved in cell wall biosynthesis